MKDQIETGTLAETPADSPAGKSSEAAEPREPAAPRLRIRSALKAGYNASLNFFNGKA